MGLGSPAGVDDVYSSHNGIVQGHAYGMLDVKSVFINGVEYRMIKVLVCGCCCGMERWYRANTVVVCWWWWDVTVCAGAEPVGLQPRHGDTFGVGADIKAVVTARGRQDETEAAI